MTLKKFCKQFLFWLALILFVVLGVILIAKVIAAGVITQTSVLLFLLAFLGTIALLAILFFGFTARTAGRKKEAKGATTAPIPVQAKSTKKTSSSWLGWAVAIVLVAVGVWGYRYYKNLTQPPAPRSLIAAMAPTKPERVIEVIALVGRWSENISIPPNHWFRIMPGGKIQIRMWNGKEMDSEPGNDTWFGDNILDANFRFQSRESGDVKVKVVMRPK